MISNDKTIFTPEERLNAAIKYEKTDRIPCAPLIDSYAARFAGITHHDFFFNNKKAFDAFALLKTRYPVWDIRRSLYPMFYGNTQKVIGYLRNKLPGIDLPVNHECQFTEFEAMKRDDYSIILNEGFEKYMIEYYRRIHGASEEEIQKAEAEQVKTFQEEINESINCGQAALYGYITSSAEEIISFTRSFPEFIRDVYQIPDLMQEITSIATDSVIESAVKFVSKTKVYRIFLGSGRFNGKLFSLSYFEKFCWIYLKRIINSLIKEGITPVLHLDGDWSLNLPYFLELPEKKLIIEFDGDTDIFNAKKVLNSHSCLLGNVPSTLLAAGMPKQIKEYCHRLITEIGKSGGFILGSGCALPYMAEHRNVEAFFDSLTG